MRAGQKNHFPRGRVREVLKTARAGGRGRKTHVCLETPKYTMRTCERFIYLLQVNENRTTFLPFAYLYSAAIHT